MRHVTVNPKPVEIAFTGRTRPHAVNFLHPGAPSPAPESNVCSRFWLRRVAWYCARAYPVYAPCASRIASVRLLRYTPPCPRVARAGRARAVVSAAPAAPCLHSRPPRRVYPVASMRRGMHVALGYIRPHLCPKHSSASQGPHFRCATRRCSGLFSMVLSPHLHSQLGICIVGITARQTTKKSPAVRILPHHEQPTETRQSRWTP